MKHLIFSVSLLFLFSCGSKTAHLQTMDKESDAQVHISGEKASSLDPFKVTIAVEGNGLKESIATEIYAGVLDSTNVQFEWQEPGICLITFTQQDNTTRKILAVSLEKKIGLKEIGLE